MIDPNGSLVLEESGYVWITGCRKCGTVQRCLIGRQSLADARAAVDSIDRSPMECPGGYHVELTGWKRLWSLDLMLTQLATALQPQPEPVGTFIPTLIGASQDGWAN